LLVCVQLYEADKISCDLFSLQRPMIEIVALCDPDSLPCLVIYTSKILMYFTWLNEIIRIPCVSNYMRPIKFLVVCFRCNGR
jgi:hypothetical protein